MSRGQRTAEQNEKSSTGHKTMGHKAIQATCRSFSGMQPKTRFGGPTLSPRKGTYGVQESEKRILLKLERGRKRRRAEPTPFGEPKKREPSGPTLPPPSGQEQRRPELLTSIILCVCPA